MTLFADQLMLELWKIKDLTVEEGVMVAILAKVTIAVVMVVLVCYYVSGYFVSFPCMR
jgi:hypothetical protein